MKQSFKMDALPWRAVPEARHQDARQGRQPGAIRFRGGVTSLNLMCSNSGAEKHVHSVRTRWVEPRRQVAREIVRHAMQSGELRAGLDPDVVLDALYGPFYHRLLVPRKNGVITDAFIDALVDTVFSGLEPNGGGT